MTLQFSILPRFDNVRHGKLTVQSKYSSSTLTTPTFLPYFKLNSERLRLLESLPLQELCLGAACFLDYGGITSGKKWVDSLRSNPERLHEAFGRPLCSFPLVDLNAEHIDSCKPVIHGPVSSARFFSDIDLEVVAPPRYICRASLDPKATSELEALNLESTSIFLKAYSKKIESGAIVFVHLLKGLDGALRAAGFDPVSVDGLVAISTKKIEEGAESRAELQRPAMQTWENAPRLVFGGSRLKLENLVQLGADLITSPEPFWRALYYQYLVPAPKETKTAIVRVKSPGSLKRLECDCPVCARGLLAKAFSRDTKTQFINLLCIHNNNVTWHQLEALRSGMDKP